VGMEKGDRFKINRMPDGVDVVKDTAKNNL
jgi:hypothetical protein